MHNYDNLLYGTLNNNNYFYISFTVKQHRQMFSSAENFITKQTQIQRLDL